MATLKGNSTSMETLSTPPPVLAIPNWKTVSFSEAPDRAHDAMLDADEPVSPRHPRTRRKSSATNVNSGNIAIPENVNDSNSEGTNKKPNQNNLDTPRQRNDEPPTNNVSQSPRVEGEGHKRPQKRDSKPQGNRRTRRPLPKPKAQRPVSRVQKAAAIRKLKMLTRRAITRAEEVQTRAEKHAALLQAAAAAAAATPSAPDSGSRDSESSNMQRLNDGGPSQNVPRVWSGVRETKFYNGVKYERKADGPFPGKLASPGALININGDDYVEYRVLAKVGWD